MIVTVEISYYPLIENYNTSIDNFIKKVSKYNSIQIEPGKMSTILTGEYFEVMRILSESMGESMEKHPSVFNLKISNSCPI